MDSAFVDFLWLSSLRSWNKGCFTLTHSNNLDTALSTTTQKLDCSNELIMEMKCVKDVAHILDAWVEYHYTVQKDGWLAALSTSISYFA